MAAELKIPFAFEDSETDIEISPEQKLLATILMSAITEATGYGQSVGDNSAFERKRREAQAKRWVFCDSVHCSPDKGISFCYICEALSLDIGSVRSLLRRRGDVVGNLMKAFRDRNWGEKSAA